MIKEPQIGDYIRVKTKLGDKLCIIDLIDKTNNKIHFKNKKYGLTVNLDRVRYVSSSWKKANFVYTSFN